MVFSSLLFVLLFLPAVMLIYSLCRSVKAKNICLLTASLLFYSWASLRFTAILLFDVAVCWFLTRMMEFYQGRSRKAVLALCVAVLLAALCAFKYTGFLLDNLQRLTGFPKAVPDIVLPLGISFYTFQLISYAADVYRGKVRAERRFWMLLLYTSLFFQCVAGPIVRYGDVAAELRERTVTPAQTSRGVSRFAVGLAKKAILANSCAAVADAFFAGDAAALAAQPAMGLWLSAFAYALQIYLDFSAYSDMAIGMGLMCGFHLTENFNYPYVSTSVTEFWRYWHISLSRFFRDYVYIPLGGNRRGKGRQILNLLAVWLLTGLWHGASWNYILWGLYFFVLLVVEKMVLGRFLEKIPGLVRYVFVAFAILICWVIFRFEDLGALWTVLKGMFCQNGNAFAGLTADLAFRGNWALLLVSAAACTPVWTNLRQALRDKARGSALARTAYAVFDVAHPALLLVISAMALAGNSYNPFIYWTF